MGEWGKPYTKVKSMKEQGYVYQYAKRKLCIYDKDDNLVNMFDNATQASEFIGIKTSSIATQICKGIGLGKKHYRGEWIIIELDKQEVNRERYVEGILRRGK